MLLVVECSAPDRHFVGLEGPQGHWDEQAKQARQSVKGSSTQDSRPQVVDQAEEQGVQQLDTTKALRSMDFDMRPPVDNAVEVVEADDRSSCILRQGAHV